MGPHEGSQDQQGVLSWRKQPSGQSLWASRSYNAPPKKLSGHVVEASGLEKAVFVPILKNTHTSLKGGLGVVPFWAESARYEQGWMEQREVQQLWPWKKQSPPRCWLRWALGTYSIISNNTQKYRPINQLVSNRFLELKKALGRSVLNQHMHYALYTTWRLLGASSSLFGGRGKYIRF